MRASWKASSAAAAMSISPTASAAPCTGTSTTSNGGATSPLAPTRHGSKRTTGPGTTCGPRVELGTALELIDAFLDSGDEIRREGGHPLVQARQKIARSRWFRRLRDRRKVFGQRSGVINSKIPCACSRLFTMHRNVRQYHRHAKRLRLLHGRAP